MEDTLRVKVKQQRKQQRCLNPCFNGRYSQSITDINESANTCVLILVLMEDTLREMN